ncbi:hypothetical protein ACH4L7_33365 [Streptomyces anulatus]
MWHWPHAVLLTTPQSAKQLDWSRAAIDSSHARAARLGPKVVPARSIAQVRGSKHHVLVD